MFCQLPFIWPHACCWHIGKGKEPVVPWQALQVHPLATPPPWLAQMPPSVGLRMAPLAKAQPFAMVLLAEPSPVVADAKEELQRPSLVSVISAAVRQLVTMQGQHRVHALAFHLWAQ